MSCKHDGFFRVGEITVVSKGSNPVAQMRFMMFCPHDCGFFLNFCPETAGRFRCEEWKEKVTHFETIRTIVLGEIHESAKKPVKPSESL